MRIAICDDEKALAFLTNYPGHVFEGYEVAALRYLMKLVTAENLFPLLDLVLERVGRVSRYLVLEVDGEQRRVEEDSVCAGRRTQRPHQPECLEETEPGVHQLLPGGVTWSFGSSCWLQGWRRQRQEQLQWRYLSLLSVVFQDFKLFSMKLGENVAASVDYDPCRVWDCLEKAGMRQRGIDDSRSGTYYPPNCSAPDRHDPHPFGQSIPEVICQCNIPT